MCYADHILSRQTDCVSVVYALSGLACVLGATVRAAAEAALRFELTCVSVLVSERPVSV